MIKKYFLSGLAIFLPVVLTFIIVMFLVNFLTKPFVGIVKSIFSYYGILNSSGEQTLLFISKLIALIGVISIIFIAGFLAQIIFIKWFGRLGNYLLHKIPLINTVYKSIQDVVETLFVKKEEKKNDFSSVVLVPFPHKDAYSIGFITNSYVEELSDENFKKNVSVFVPGTPNPTMGFMIQYEKSEIIPLPMKVEDALKFIVSIGVICPNSNEA